MVGTVLSPMPRRSQMRSRLMQTKLCDVVQTNNDRLVGIAKCKSALFRFSSVLNQNYTIFAYLIFCRYCAIMELKPSSYPVIETKLE